MDLFLGLVATQSIFIKDHYRPLQLTRVDSTRIKRSQEALREVSALDNER